MKMSDESRDFEVRVVWDPIEGGKALVKGKPTIRVVKPKGFNNEPDLFTPEDLVVAATTVCFMNSFIYFTKRMRIEFKSFECEAVGTLDKVGRSFEITKIVQRSRVVIHDKALRPKIERAFELGAKYCFVANSLKCPVIHEDEIIVDTSQS